MILFRIKSQPGAAYKKVAYKKKCNVALQSSKCEEIAFPREFLFVFKLLSLGRCCKKIVVKDKGFGKNTQRGGLLYNRW